MDKPESNVLLSESWLEGQPPPCIGVDLAVSEARKELKGWSEKQVRYAAEALDRVFDAWEKESDERECLLGHLVLSDSIDLFIRLLKEKDFQPILEHVSILQSIAVLILKEAAHGYNYAALKGSIILLKMKSETMDAIGDMFDRVWLPDISLGVKVREGGRVAHEKEHGTPEEKDRRWSGWQLQLEQRHMDQPTIGITKLRKELAAELKIHYKTLEDHTKKTW